MVIKVTKLTDTFKMETKEEKYPKSLPSMVSFCSLIHVPNKKVKNSTVIVYSESNKKSIYQSINRTLINYHKYSCHQNTSNCFKDCENRIVHHVSIKHLMKYRFIDGFGNLYTIKALFTIYHSKLEFFFCERIFDIIDVES